MDCNFIFISTFFGEKKRILGNKFLGISKPNFSMQTNPISCRLFQWCRDSLSKQHMPELINQSVSHFYICLIFSRKSATLLEASYALLHSSRLSEWSYLQDSVAQIIFFPVLYNFLHQLILYCCELQCLSQSVTFTLVLYFQESM